MIHWFVFVFSDYFQNSSYFVYGREMLFNSNDESTHLILSESCRSKLDIEFYWILEEKKRNNVWQRICLKMRKKEAFNVIEIL